MARKRQNKKKTQNTMLLPAPLAGLAIIILTCAVGRVYLKSRCERIGKEIQALEVTREKLRNQFINEKCRWTRMKSPQSIEAALDRHNINMALPRNDQVVWVYERENDREKAKRLARSTVRHVHGERMVLHE